MLSHKHLNGLIATLFHYFIIVGCIFFGLFILNRTCNNCIFKNVTTILNSQGYSYDKSKEVQPYEPEEGGCHDSAKCKKQYFDTAKTTGMFNKTEEPELHNPRISN